MTIGSGLAIAAIWLGTGLAIAMDGQSAGPIGLFAILATLFVALASSR